MDAQQELFTKLKLSIEALGYDVYDGFLPPEETPYPFVYLGDFRQSDTELKNAVMGSVHPVIHVWHNDPQQRGTVSQMLLQIKTVCRQLDHTDNFAWSVRDITQQIFPDNTTKSPLLHGVIEAGFYFS
jgi:hypothetical protein